VREHRRLSARSPTSACTEKKSIWYLERLSSQNITITTRLIDTVTTPMLLKTVQSRKLEPNKLITHHFKLQQILDAYDTFARAAQTGALKVIIEA